MSQLQLEETLNSAAQWKIWELTEQLGLKWKQRLF
ncbi:hypothetical protein X975_24412, partial [Stegodyphus mimosarum]